VYGSHTRTGNRNTLGMTLLLLLILFSWYYLTGDVVFICFSLTRTTVIVITRPAAYVHRVNGRLADRSDGAPGLVRRVAAVHLAGPYLIELFIIII